MGSTLLSARRMAWVALLPMALTVLVAYLGSVLWSLRVSLSSSRTFPTDDFVGLSQYARLFASERWLESLQHLASYGVPVIAASLVLGYLLAAFIDARVRAEGVLRTIYLYPYAMSMVATGLVWQWLLNPASGLQDAVRRLGWSGFEFDWVVDQDQAIFAVALAGVWQSAGLVMALMLAGLRAVEPEIWKAARLDGVPAWRVHLWVVLPMLAPVVATVVVLLFAGVVKVFDVVVAMTQGGPGMATDVPAKFIMDHLFVRANIAQASAAAIALLAGVLAVAAPVLYARSRSRAAAA